jgi:tellurite resistance protein TehA-like permease
MKLKYAALIAPAVPTYAFAVPALDAKNRFTFLLASIAAFVLAFLFALPIWRTWRERIIVSAVGFLFALVISLGSLLMMGFALEKRVAENMLNIVLFTALCLSWYLAARVTHWAAKSTKSNPKNL